ncbi:MAG: hypothetical protein ACE5HI_01535 [bacterium]
MKTAIKNLFVFALLISSIFWMNCNGDNNPILDLNDLTTLAGNYELISITDKTGSLFEAGFTTKAGEATQIVIEGVTVTVTITGTLVLTETRYTFSLTVSIATAGLPPQTDTETSSGTYTISGSTLTTVEDDTGETDTATLSVSGSQLTIDDDEITLVFEKQ